MAIGDGRVRDALALVHPEVVWMPSIRPGRSVYEGRPGVAQFVADLHAAYGKFQLTVQHISVEADDGTDMARVTAQLGGTRETASGPVVLPQLTAVFTVRLGWVTTMESATDD